MFNYLEMKSKFFYRRKFLNNLAQQSLFFASAIFLMQESKASSKLNYTFQVISAPISNIDIAASLGECCLNKNPHLNKNARDYFNKLSKTFEQPARDFDKDKKKFSSDLHKKIKADFFYNNLSFVDDWVISQTEELYFSTIAWIKNYSSHNVY